MIQEKSHSHRTLSGEEVCENVVSLCRLNLHWDMTYLEENNT